MDFGFEAYDSNDTKIHELGWGKFYFEIKHTDGDLINAEEYVSIDGHQEDIYPFSGNCV